METPYKMKRYLSLTEYYQNLYQKKLSKVPLDGGFTCPNRDGSKGTGGCIYCSNKGSGEFAGNREENVLQQFEEISKRQKEKWPNCVCIPYFQNYSNTYGSIEHMKSVFEPFLSIKESIPFISIATRPDCLQEEVLEYLNQLNQQIPIQIELGLQTTHKSTMEYLNLKYTLEDFYHSIQKLSEIHIPVVVHIINGLPGETKEDMLETIRVLNDTPISGIKFHMLHVLKNTALEKEYLSNPFPILSLEEYVDIVVSQLEILRGDIVIHRLCADGPKDEIICPLWSQKKLVVMNEIDKKLKAFNTYQGKKYVAK